uniref:BPTI/Kunitz inhibitor domain-containing protein n=1 Tax=Drosophila melanogaster TaxID=7227 RepID=M9NEQ6_DROME|nr:uncharacterized protein Dmel_CG43145 [Drosophila melanogaster]AFH03535.1 uncharacterized protein Dmel_CG43145 [Drosophila melanogaster]|eukprot:NP_001245859.1 uncharacterized protein Dmel_CG43145 [Drosophila melanogaster]
MRSIYLALILCCLCPLITAQNPICRIKASFVGKCKGFAYIPRKHRCVRISGDCYGRGNFFKRFEDCQASCIDF